MGRLGRTARSYLPVTFRDSMAKTAGVRVGAKRTIELDGVRVTNKTANSILVRRTPKGIEVTDCCLEEQGL